ncbi:MAG: hypothetical protein Q4F34_00675 [Prevotellaceae bacterium]|nr:hypothetical protein [Prevotellaceae bacterium]
MNTLWSKILFVVLDVAMLVYLVFAMTSFNKPLIATDDTCPKVDINIEETATDGFLTTDDIKAILMANKLYPLGKHIDEVNTRRIEEVLTDNQLIETAMCYTTSENNVIINLKQRTAVVRVKSINGQDYYIDSKGRLCKEVSFKDGIYADKRQLLER